jgi:cell division protein FtsB
MERNASAGFEGIAQMLLEQKKLMDALEAENRELRRQLDDLRRGVGISVVIEGKTIQLATEQASNRSMQPVPDEHDNGRRDEDASQSQVASSYML